MPYNWEFSQWPDFTFEQDVLSKHQVDFLLKSGELTGARVGRRFSLIPLESGQRLVGKFLVIYVPYGISSGGVQIDIA